MDKQIEQIMSRQVARLLENLKPLKIPPIEQDAILKYFNYACLDIKELLRDKEQGDKENGNTKKN